MSATWALVVSAFLLAQLCYITALWPFRARSLLARPALVVPYAVACVALLVVLGPQTGALLPAVAAYAVALTCTAVLATGLGRLAGAGGVLFLIADGLIALDAFSDHALPAHGFWVMLGYLLAQLFLVVGIINARHSDTESPSASARSQRP